MEHLDHLILANLGLWAGARNRSVLEEAELLFSRSALHASGSQYDALPKLSYGAAGQYLEANIVGNPSLPDSVNFLVASFPKLFGTHAGQQVQQLSAVRGWPLVWASAMDCQNWMQEVLMMRSSLATGVSSIQWFTQVTC